MNLRAAKSRLTRSTRSYDAFRQIAALKRAPPIVHGTMSFSQMTRSQLDYLPPFPFTPASAHARSTDAGEP
jgi:hypothetical protein